MYHLTRTFIRENSRAEVAKRIEEFNKRIKVIFNRNRLEGGLNKDKLKA